MKKEETTVLILDETSRTKVKTDVASIASRGVLVYSTFQEFLTSDWKSVSNVIVLEGYLHEKCGLPDLKLYKSLTGLRFILLGADRRLLESARDWVDVYQCDVSLLSFDVIQAALFSDSALNATQSISSDGEVVALAQRLLEERDDTQVVKLAEEFLAVVNRENRWHHECVLMKQKLKNCENVNALLQKDNRRLLRGYTSLVQRAAELNESLKQYEMAFSQDIYVKLNLHNYSNRPSIIYLKEYEELINLELLIETLFNVLKIQNRQSVKVLRLYDSSGSRRVRTLPEMYTVLGNRWLGSDVIANDYLCKTGDYTKVLETLLYNKTNLDVLIIVDCKDYNDVVLNGSVLYLNLCRNPKHLEALNLSVENTIVNGNEDTNPGMLCWDTYDLSGKSKQEAFNFLCSRKVIQRILELSRIFGLAV